MTIELKPLGNACNLGCDYCYQEPMRNAGNTRVSSTYDLDLMLAEVDKKQSVSNNSNTVALFGGEALLTPIKDIEKIFKHCFEKYGKSGIQTNGSLITDKHIELFKKYNVHVGVSIDGANDLNGLRKSLSQKVSTDEMTNKTIENLRKMANEEVSVGVILTVHKLNGIGDNLKRLMNFIRWMGDIGIKNGNIHLMEIDSIVAYNYSLNSEQNTVAFLELAKFFEENKDLSYHPFKEMEGLINPETIDHVASCVWRNCDPLNTQAVYGIEANGGISNCGMVNKEGIEWHKANNTGFQRDVVLWQTKDEQNGCNGCQYFMMCNGYCEGSAVDGDWRNKTIHCKTIKSLFNFYEEKLIKRGITPVSRFDNIKEMTELYVEILGKGERPPVSYVRDIVQSKRGMND